MARNLDRSTNDRYHFSGENTFLSHKQQFSKEKSLFKFSVEALTFWSIIQMLGCPRWNYYFI